MECNEKECPDCDGEGFHEIGPECSQPASNCCGGCYTRRECNTCDGAKVVEDPDFEEE